MKKYYAFVIMAILIASTPVFADTVEERLERIEQKIEQLSLDIINNRQVDGVLLENAEQFNVARTCKELKAKTDSPYLRELVILEELSCDSGPEVTHFIVRIQTDTSHLYRTVHKSDVVLFKR